MPFLSGSRSAGTANWRWLLGLLGLAILAMASFLVAARSGWLTPSEDEMRRRYLEPGAQFGTFAGANIVYKDEGQGPVVVLLHGSFASLRQWDAWTAALKPRYRVIRYDRPPMGLSGAAGSAGLDVEREMRELTALVDALKVERFVLVATSSAGATGAAYAAAHPERLQGVVLANIAAGAFAQDRSHLTTRMKFALAVDPFFAGWHPTMLWDEVLKANFFDPSKVTSALAREWTDLNNRAQRLPPGAASGPPGKSSPFDRSVDDLRKIQIPTLLLWSQHDHELPVETVGQKAFGLLGAADKQMVVVPDCGHMMPLECGSESAAEAMKFLDRIAAR